MSRSHSHCARPALLVFSLGPKADCQRRPLLPPRLTALERELRSRCLAGALDAGRKAGFTLEFATADECGEISGDTRAGVRSVAQSGDTFGRRLRSALESCWERNPDGPVVLVGGDIPELESAHLLRAARTTRLDPNAVVIGPSPDGGFYLLAMARPIDDALRQVRWCGIHTRDDLTRALGRIGRQVVELEPLEDLDRPSDLLALLGRDWSLGRGHALAMRILAALRDLARPTVAPVVRHPLAGLSTVPAPRGPPI